MLHLRNNLIGIEQGDESLFSDFEADGPMWAADGSREVRHRVTFSKEFGSPPQIMLSMTLVDVDHTRNYRAELVKENVSKEGFDIVFKTWSDTRIARIRAEWTAIGELRDPDMWDV